MIKTEPFSRTPCIFSNLSKPAIILTGHRNCIAPDVTRQKVAAAKMIFIKN